MECNVGILFIFPVPVLAPAAEPSLHVNCTDNPFFANCALIVKASYCTNKYYARFCCRSCTLGGQLPHSGPHLIDYGKCKPRVFYSFFFSFLSKFLIYFFRILNFFFVFIFLRNFWVSFPSVHFFKILTLFFRILFFRNFELFFNFFKFF